MVERPALKTTLNQDLRQPKRLEQKLYRNSLYKSGFTLVELMIVVCIIGILTTVATVGYNMYMNQARVTRLKSYVVSVAAKQMDAMSRQVTTPFSGSYAGSENAYKNVLGFNETVYPGVELYTEAWTASTPSKCGQCATYGIPPVPNNRAGYMVVARQDLKPGGPQTTVYMTNSMASPLEVNVGE